MTQTKSYAAAALLAPLLAVLGLSGCDDNPACIFTTGCRVDPNQPIGEATAVLPQTGLRVVDDPPVIRRLVPADGADNQSPFTPVVIEFS